MLSFAFLKTSKISFSFSSFLNLEELKVLVFVFIYKGVGYIFFTSSLVFISSFFLNLNLFWHMFSSALPLLSMITLTFYFRFNVYEGNFLLACVANLSMLEATCHIYFFKLWILDFVSCWENIKFYSKFIVLEANFFIISCWS